MESNPLCAVALHWLLAHGGIHSAEYMARDLGIDQRHLPTLMHALNTLSDSGLVRRANVWGANRYEITVDAHPGEDGSRSITRMSDQAFAAASSFRVLLEKATAAGNQRKIEENQYFYRLFTERHRCLSSGAWGEEALDPVLSQLASRGCRILTDRLAESRGASIGNIDHIVVGPTGVFVIDAKNWKGKVTYVNGVLDRSPRYEYTQGLVKKTLDGIKRQTVAVRQRLRSAPIVGVLCFVGNNLESPIDYDLMDDPAGDMPIMCVNAEHIADFVLYSLPEVLSEGMVNAYADTLEAALPAA